jgi:hypothetical protein
MAAPHVNVTAVMWASARGRRRDRPEPSAGRTESRHVDGAARWLRSVHPQPRPQLVATLRLPNDYEASRPTAPSNPSPGLFAIRGACRQARRSTTGLTGGLSLDARPCLRFKRLV